MEQITLVYTEEMIRKINKAYWWKQTGTKFFLALILVMAWLVAELFDGNTSWQVGAVSTFVAICVAIVVMLYMMPLSRSLKKFRGMKNGVAHLQICDSYFVVSSSLGESKVNWEQIKTVVQLDNCWVV